MIGRLEARLRWLRRLLSRSEWIARLARLPRTTDRASAAGLVMIQIDGLSQTQFERALKRGRLPFLARLLRREDYRLHTFYSGLPSSTPAVQGELFYGVRTAVPAFSFREPQSGQIVRMLDGKPVERVQRRLVDKGQPLLAGGASYSNIYTGGAAESHFCPTTIGWDLLRAINPIWWAGVLIWYGASVVRIAGLTLLEFALAISDMFRGLIEGQDLAKELKFVPSRVLVSIVGRELVTIGATLDVARGLPIVHLNFLGYDEQAHRRGPSSAFAHWSLKGIDRCIRQIWLAARRSPRRDYDVWIYADHGQEETIPYPLAAGRPLRAAVEEVLTRVLEEPTEVADVAPHRGIQSSRAVLLRRKRKPRRNRDHRRENVPSDSSPSSPDESLRPTERPSERDGATASSEHDAAPEERRTPQAAPLRVELAAMGPVGLVYLDQPLSSQQCRRAAEELVHRAEVPLVLWVEPEGHVRAVNRSGQWSLPNDAAHVLGANHPFLAEATSDLIALCHHQAAGQLILSGWDPERPPISFPIESGAHAGPGSEETRAFALLPADAPVPHTGRGFLRPADLRAAALHLLDRSPLPATARPYRPLANSRVVRIMTYNVHACLGMDGRLSTERIARVIAQCDADVVALQELDVGRVRSGAVDQAHQIAERLEMEFHFHPAIQLEEEQYGDAVLSRFPLRLVRAAGLPGVPGVWREPRGALWTAITVGDRELQLINTHLGLSARERRVQVEALIGPEWLADPRCTGPTVLCGDFNALPRSLTCRRIGALLRDAQQDLENHRPRRTLPGRLPLGRIDHVFVSREIIIRQVRVPRTDLARVASDHLPLLVEIELP